MDMSERVARDVMTVQLGADYDVLAPDGSEIRLLTRNRGASVAHGSLPPEGVSLAVRHRTIDEIWYGLDGEADLWRKLGAAESIVRMRAGTAITIPLGTSFQFRTVGAGSFSFLMCTTPPWPGDDEAELVSGVW
jgi:mannose-6-phosphate isomerase-like protein (cupin superfamily)